MSVSLVKISDVKISDEPIVGARAISLLFNEDGALEFYSVGIVTLIWLNGVDVDNGGFYYFNAISHYEY